MAPGRDGGVVPPPEDLGDAEPPDLEGAGVVRVVEEALAGAEGVLDGALLVAEDARAEPGDRVEEHHRRQLAAGEDVVPDGDLLGPGELEGPFVHAFVAPGEEDEAGRVGQLADEGLVEAAALGGEVDRAGAARMARLCLVEGPQHGFRHQDHAGAAAERAVVHDAVAALAEEAEVDEVHADEAAADRAPEDGLLEERAEEGGEEGDDGGVHVTSPGHTLTPRMFTGIVTQRARVTEVVPAPSGEAGALRLVLELASPLPGTGLGDSVALDGCCLTVVEVAGRRVAFDAIPETLRKTTLGRRRVGDLVHVEAALRFGDALGGHLVQGHVDGVGTVTAIERRADDVRLRIAVPPALAGSSLPKGSITVDGVSLTVGECGEDWFTVYLIPHTLEVTGLGAKRPGDPVNLEADVVGRYVEHHVRRYLAGAARPNPETSR